MKWLIVILVIHGEPSIVAGWEPIQVVAERCEEVASRTSEYITTSTHYTDHSVVCADDVSQETIDMALSRIGTGL